jgi:hypothetical protein
MELKETKDLMCSSEYKDRFVAEYLQLKIRRNGLANMLMKYKEGTLTFTPKCSYELLYEQLVHMESYLGVLEQRAVIEDIPLFMGASYGECK